MVQTDALATARFELQKEEEQSQAQADESWAHPPPGEPGRETAAAMEVEMVMPTHKLRPSGRDFSMEDLEVARALTGLRQASPPEQTSRGHTYNAQHIQSSSQQEPLLSLLTSQHPLLGNAINHSIIAYNTGKSYSGPFKSSVDYVERNIASPVANTVGTAGRISGVENGVRWWLERGRSSSNVVGSQMSPTSSNGHKRRREDSEADLERTMSAQRSRAPSDMSLSQGEYLPAYDSNRSPSYSSRDPHPLSDDGEQYQEYGLQGAQLGNSNWQTRLILSTSGLGVAMSHESRRSLKYCLSWLRWANGRLGRLLYSLQTVLSEYEAAQRHALERANSPRSDQYSPPHQPRDLQAISAQLAQLKGECVKTLQSAMDIVSKYAGGALPENARFLVRKHLTSLPQRFAFMASLQEKEEEVLRKNAEARRMAAEQTKSPAALEEGVAGVETDMHSPVANDDAVSHEHENVVLGARRVIVLAREGLDMMAQVSAVVDGTITSAEDWCEKLGRKPLDDSSDSPQRENVTDPAQSQQHGSQKSHDQVEQMDIENGAS